MTESKVKSWIFLSTSLASQKEPADLKAISVIADGINHLVPTDKELKTALKWLLSKELISKQGNKYALTVFGKTKFENASKKTSVTFKIWDNLDIDIQNIKS